MQGMSVENWLAGVQTNRGDQDGPALLLPEIGALLRDRRVWLPFLASSILVSARWLGSGPAIPSDSKVTDGVFDLDPPETAFDAVYFGVPTIVCDEALFSAPDWTCDLAREAARRVTSYAATHGATLIVSGLGSGDIGVDDRIEDMGGGKVVAFKDFGTFQDWVIARWL